MSDDNAQGELSAYDRDKLAKRALVRRTLAAHCAADSPHEEVRAIAAALEKGESVEDVIKLTNLSGGYTNYTYSVTLATEEGTETKLFVKLCFPRAFWNPDPDYHYDTNRIVAEKVMMEQFAALAPGCAPQPYLLIDLEERMKLLVTAWAAGDEQLANQFIDGDADLRVAEKLGASVAALHCTEMDPHFNTNARECMLHIFPALRKTLVELATSSESNSPNRFAKLAREFGPSDCGTFIDRAAESYRSKQIPVHADLHAFNCLVEAKPGLLEEECFGKEGLVVVCDWEMAMMGPLGLDTGRAFSIPVACILAHSLNRNEDVAPGLMQWMDTYWDSYASGMKSKGKEGLLVDGYRNGIAWLGWKLTAMSINEWFIPFLPIEQNEAEIGAFRESLGVVGLSLMRLGFGGEEEGTLLVQLQCALKETIQAEVSLVASRTAERPKMRRRSSMLRQQNRRVSDAFLNLSASTRKSLRMIAEDM
ncbi:hypothetical protein ACHAXT_011016 [Thalassiosira profunda]